jgi:hypothetical protein
MDLAAPMTAATERLLQAGLLGVFVLIFAIAIVVLWREAKQERVAYLKQIEETQKARIDDAKASHAQMLSVVQQCTQALGTASSTMVTQKETMMELRDTLREFGDELRSFGEDHRNRPRGR